MELKKYQHRTLEILDNFLTDAKSIGNAKAFEKYQAAQDYNSQYQPLTDLENVPYVCLRLPTGGGKTLLGTCAIKSVAENFLEQEFPFVLWLVPSNEIKQQTLKKLNDVKSFYNQFLYKNFQGGLQIFDVADFHKLRPQDLEQKLNICISTIQTFRRDVKDVLKVFQADEEIESCFRNIPQENYFRLDDKKRYKTFANLLAYLRPLMIVDEAHNCSTTLSFETIKFLRPSAVIELTATPATNSNVLVKISAEELYREEMIKLPIILGEVSDSPGKTIDFAVQKRAALEEIALTEDDYIRPIVLYQAENRNLDCNVDFVKNYLIEDAKVPAEQIAIATGDNPELNGVNLFLKNCPIRHIITVQALKEGWDCPFASILCSLTKTHSSRDAEQLLGRVLRMPYAKKRSLPELNQAYAFFKINSWTEALTKIKDNLFGMGFDDSEVNFALNVQQKLFNQKITIKIETEQPPRIDSLNFILQSQISVEKVAEGYKVTFDNVTDDDLKEIENNKQKIFSKAEDREKFSKAVLEENFKQKKNNSPAERGEIFSIPQLCLDLGEGLKIAKCSDFIPADDWTLTETNDYALEISKVESDIKFFELNLHGNKLVEKLLPDDENLFVGKTNWTQTELISWLEEKIEHNFITAEDFLEYTRRVLERLMNEKNFTLAELVQLRFSLKKMLSAKIETLIDEASKKVFNLFTDNVSGKIRVEKDIAFTFDSKIYPAKKFYTGSTKFDKHFYSVIGDMNSEEIDCARFIDANPKVEFWIRNIEREEYYSFWMPMHRHKFYPDFVVKLKDGTYAAIEYKGEKFLDTLDTEEKNMLGERWANKSNGCCKFLLAVKRDKNGRDISAQVRDFFN